LSLQAFCTVRYKPTQAMTKPSRKRKAGIPFTEKEARIFHRFSEYLNGTHGEELRKYANQFLKLLPQAIKLRKKGVKVRISLPDLPKRPLIIVEK
jgi:ABC-type transporter MlaC component